MAKESRTTKALTGPRQLKEMIPMYSGVYDDTDGFPSMNGWHGTGVGPNGNFVYYESSIDVNLALDDLTMFPQAVLVQDPGVYYRTPNPLPVPNIDQLQILDIISVRQLDPVEIANNMRDGNAAAGMLGTTEDFNQIIMGTWRLMGNNSTLGIASNVQTTVDVKDFSSASPFAQDRLWCYRFLMPLSDDLSASGLGSPASRFIVQVIVGKEGDLQYMMRLKNSYELQQL
ncbi:MAG: hypothetical protein ACTSUO_09370 [Candidatus Thorarchaeota archaeon]